MVGMSRAPSPFRRVAVRSLIAGVIVAAGLVCIVPWGLAMAPMAGDGQPTRLGVDRQFPPRLHGFGRSSYRVSIDPDVDREFALRRAHAIGTELLRDRRPDDRPRAALRLYTTTQSFGWPWRSHVRVEALGEWGYGDLTDELPLAAHGLEARGETRLPVMVDWGAIGANLVVYTFVIATAPIAFVGVRRARRQRRGRCPGCGYQLAKGHAVAAPPPPAGRIVLAGVAATVATSLVTLAAMSRMESAWHDALAFRQQDGLVRGAPRLGAFGDELLWQAIDLADAGASSTHLARIRGRRNAAIPNDARPAAELAGWIGDRVVTPPDFGRTRRVGFPFRALSVTRTGVAPRSHVWVPTSLPEPTSLPTFRVYWLGLLGDIAVFAAFGALVGFAANGFRRPRTGHGTFRCPECGGEAPATAPDAPSAEVRGASAAPSSGDLGVRPEQVRRAPPPPGGDRP